MITTAVSSKRFSWDRITRSYVAEISDLGPGFRFERVFPDACDMGLDMRSEKTGEIARFVIVQELRTPGGEDIGGWQLRPTLESIRKHPKLANVQMTIFND